MAERMPTKYKALTAGMLIDCARARRIVTGPSKLPSKSCGGKHRLSPALQSAAVGTNGHTELVPISVATSKRIVSGVYPFMNAFMYTNGLRLEPGWRRP